MMAEDRLGAATAPPKRRDGMGREERLLRVGQEMMEGSSSSKTAGRGSSSPCSVIRTARRGTGKGANRILRRLVEATHSGAEPVLGRGTRSSSEAYGRGRELLRGMGGVALSEDGGVLTSSDEAEEESE